MGTYSYLEEKPSREYELNRSFKIKKIKKKKKKKKKKSSTNVFITTSTVCTDKAYATAKCNHFRVD